MSKLIINSNPLLLIPELAVIIGINESIVLQQIHYWLIFNKQSNKNYKDNHFWTYNSYSNWQKQFPFWSTRTVRSIFKNLETMNLLISSNFNKVKYDRTKWYRINYDELFKLIRLHDYTCGNIFSIENEDVAQPIPEKKSNDNYNVRVEKVEKYYNTTQNKNTPTPLFDNKEIILIIKNYMYNLYPQKTDTLHPNLTKNQYLRVYNVLSSFMYEYSLEYDDLITMAIAFLNSNINTDYNINHFATEGILINRYFESIY